MTEINDGKQMSIYMTPDVWAEVQELKQIYFDKTYAELIRMMLVAGADAIRSGKDAAGK